MISGIYHVTFKASTQMHGEGLAVIKEAKVNGGDPGYLYLGSFSEATTGDISCKLTIRRWNPGHSSVFGNLSAFELTLSGKAESDGSSFSVKGTSSQVGGAVITISGRKISDAA